MALDNFEQELFDDLNDYQSELNKEEAWKELEEKLPTEKKRRKPFFWWFTGIGIGVGVLIVGGMLVYLNFSGDDVENSLVQRDAAILDNSSEITINNSAAIQSIEENEIAQINTKKIVADEALITQPIDSKSQNIKDQNSTTALNKNVTNSKNKNSLVTENSSPDNRPDSKTQPQFEKTNTPILSENKVANFNPDQVSNTNDLPKNTLDNTPIILSEKKAKEEEEVVITEEQNTAATAPITPQQIEVDKATKIIATNNNTIVANEENVGVIVEKKKEQEEIKSNQPILDKESRNKELQSKWQLALSATYGISKMRNSPDRRDDDLLKSKDYVGFNFKIYRQLNKHISIFSGITASQHTNLFEYNGKFSNTREEDVVVEEQYLLSGATNTIIEPGSTQYDIAIESKLWHTYRAISIPIGFAVHTNPDKQWHFQNDLAFVISPVQSISGKQVNVRELESYFIFDNSSYPTALFYGISDQLSLNYKFNNKLTIQLHGDFGLDLTSRIRGVETGELKFGYLGVGIGGVWRL